MPHDAKQPAVNPALAELSGTVLESRYQLGRVLGAGGMGAVFEARHLRLDRQVAIKVLRPSFAGHDEFIKRFLREAKAASKIRHRNVVDILDFGEAEGGLIYSVMEFLQGQDLDQLLRGQPGKRLPWTRTRRLLTQVAAGLQAAHECGVIHRDIKPANCFLIKKDQKQLVKIVDFGIAKVEEPGQSQLTSTAQVLGTPCYIAPELVRTKTPASPSSDIYSLGVLAYRMLTGHLPFTGDTTFEILHCSCFKPVPPLRQHVPSLSPAVEDFVLSMLAKRPEDRPQDMLAVREQMLALGSPSKASASKSTPPGLPASRESTKPPDVASLQWPIEARSLASAREPAGQPLGPVTLIDEADTRIQVPRRRGWLTASRMALIAVPVAFAISLIVLSWDGTSDVVATNAPAGEILPLPQRSSNNMDREEATSERSTPEFSSPLAPESVAIPEVSKTITQLQPPTADPTQSKHSRRSSSRGSTSPDSPAPTKSPVSEPGEKKT